MAMGSGRGAAGLEAPVFDRDAYDAFKLPRRMAELIAGCDRPPTTTDAARMRDDDYVLGVVVDGKARAYPLWVIDNYHAVNDIIEDHRVLITSCERCGSGSAFITSALPGKEQTEPLFRAAGVLNATLVLRDSRTGSYWNHYEGLALRGRARGRRLPWVPIYHMEWSDWRALHPDTEVIRPPDDVSHPDARHGHGREEFFARPGIDPLFLPTIVGELDTAYPENEMVLAVKRSVGWVAYPLAEVQLEDGVVQDTAGGDPTVVFAGPRPDGFTMSAFIPRVDNEVLTFVRKDGAFRDLQTGTTWTIEGEAVGGPFLGARLEPRIWFYLRWHAWVYSHRDTGLFTTNLLPPPLSSASKDQLSDFGPLLETLSSAGHEIRVRGPVVSQRRPREATASVTIYVDGHRMHVYRFASESSARDFDYLRGAWNALPLRAKPYESKTVRLGHFVLESDPEIRFADSANVVPLPSTVVRWSPLLDSEELNEISFPESSPTSSKNDLGFADVLASLRRSGFEVLDPAFLPPGQLRPGSINGIALTLEGDPFLLFRFGTDREAAAYHSSEPRSIAVGPFVLRSTPDTMYLHHAYEIAYAGDDSIRWSGLLNDSQVRAALERTIG
jgi:hypothetical protein